MTTYKLDIYTNFPGYGSRRYIITNANNQIMILADYKSVHVNEYPIMALFDLLNRGRTNHPPRTAPCTTETESFFAKRCLGQSICVFAYVCVYHTQKDGKTLKRKDLTIQ